MKRKERAQLWASLARYAFPQNYLDCVVREIDRAVRRARREERRRVTTVCGVCGQSHDPLRPCLE